MINVIRNLLLFGAPPASFVPWQNNGTWSAADVPFSNTPTLGGELFTDPGFEAWSSATDATNWLEAIAGTSTVNQETSIIHGGANAARLDVDASASNVTIRQTLTTISGTWLLLSVWLRSSAASGKNARVDVTNSTMPTGNSLALTSTYQQFFIVVRATTTGPIPTFSRQLGSASHSIYVDDGSTKAETLNTLFNVRPGASLPSSVAATGTIVANTLAGVVYGLDSISVPTNGIIATHDGVTGIKLEKLVAGVWTTVLTTTATYVSGQLPQIKPNGANTFQLWYNGSQRGADQNITDAGTGLFHGVISTYSGNTITGCTVS